MDLPLLACNYLLVTIASCTGHSFVITREIPEGEPDDIEYLSVNSYAKYGSICHGTNLYHDQSILRNGLDVDFGVRAGLSARNVIHFCVATNQRPLKHHGLHCYLDLKVAIGELGLKVMCSKTAQVVLVENCVPPQALFLTRKSPSELGTIAFPVRKTSSSHFAEMLTKCRSRKWARSSRLLVLLLDQRLLRLRPLRR